MSQIDAIELAKKLYSQLSQESDSYVRLAALKGCIAIEEANIQAEITKEALRQTINSFNGKVSQYDS